MYMQTAHDLLLFTEPKHADLITCLRDCQDSFLTAGIEIIYREQKQVVVLFSLGRSPTAA
jgi:hypothetical protein